MKIRALANREIRDEPEATARQLIADGIYEAVDEKEETRAPVAPMTTGDFSPKVKADDAGQTKRRKSQK